MRIPWKDARKQISAGRVLLDNKFDLPDGTFKQKWLIILSNKPIENNYVYCVTTSQISTYHHSYADYLEIKHPSLGNKKIIIQADLLDLISIDTLRDKYNNGTLSIRKKIPSAILNELYSIIQDSERIERYKKEWLMLRLYVGSAGNA